MIFASLVYVRVLLEIEAIKPAPATVWRRIWRTSNGAGGVRGEIYTEERVSKDFAYHQLPAGAQP
ncbi:MAG: hypothetical protein ACLRM8_08575 [Alistipes sp.]